MLFKHVSSGRTTGRKFKKKMEQWFNTTPSLCVLFKIQLLILHPTRLKIHASTSAHTLREVMCRLCYCIPKLFVLPAFFTLWQKKSHLSLKAAINDCFSSGFWQLESLAISLAGGSPLFGFAPNLRRSFTASTLH